MSRRRNFFKFTQFLISLSPAKWGYPVAYEHTPQKCAKCSMLGITSSYGRIFVLFFFQWGLKSVLLVLLVIRNKGMEFDGKYFASPKPHCRKRVSITHRAVPSRAWWRIQHELKQLKTDTDQSVTNFLTVQRALSRGEKALRALFKLNLSAPAQDNIAILWPTTCHSCSE